MRLSLLSAVLIGSLAAGGATAAILVAEVRDQADFFSANAVNEANDAIKKIHRDYKKDLLIETYKTIPADKADEFKKMDKEERSKFFNSWARDGAKTAEVNGIYMLICKEPGHLEVEVGNETAKKAFTMANRNELTKRVLTKLRQAADVKNGDDQRKIHDQALLEAVQFVQTTLRSNLGVRGAGVGHDWSPDDEPMTASHSVHHPKPMMGFMSYLPGLICFGLVAVLVIWVVIGLVRSFSGAGRGGYGGPGPGYGAPGYGAPGYGGGGGGGGGFWTGLIGGMFGAAAGSWMYDQFFRSHGDSGGSGNWGSSPAYGADRDTGSSEPRDTDYTGSGGDFGGGDNGGGGGGNDGGGGGGDFGGDAGGGGGGDFGGGGGDFGGGGGGDSGGGGGDF